MTRSHRMNEFNTNLYCPNKSLLSYYYPTSQLLFAAHQQLQ